MDIAFPDSQQTLHFDAASEAFFQERLNADETFQRQMQCFAIIAAIILIAGSVTTMGLAFAVVIPYGLLHTSAVIAATSACTFGFVMLGWVNTGLTLVKPANTLYLTNRSFYSDLKARLSLTNPMVYCRIQRAYLIKCHKAYLIYLKKCAEKTREVLQEALTQEAPRNVLTGKAIYEFSPLIHLVEDYVRRDEMT